MEPQRPRKNIVKATQQDNGKTTGIGNPPGLVRNSKQIGVTSFVSAKSMWKNTLIKKKIGTSDSAWLQ